MKYVMINLFQSEKRVQSYEFLAKITIFAPKNMNKQLITPPNFTPGEDEIQVLSGTNPGLHGWRYMLPYDGKSLPAAVDELFNLASEWDQTTFYIMPLRGVSAEEGRRLFAPFRRLYNVRFPEEYLSEDE